MALRTKVSDDGRIYISTNSDKRSIASTICKLHPELKYADVLRDITQSQYCIVTKYGAHDAYWIDADCKVATATNLSYISYGYWFWFDGYTA